MLSIFTSNGFLKEEFDKANIGKDEDNAFKPVEYKNCIDKRSFMLPSQGRRHDSSHIDYLM